METTVKRKPRSDSHLLLVECAPRACPPPRHPKPWDWTSADEGPTTYRVRILFHDKHPHATIGAEPLFEFEGTSESFSAAASLTAKRFIENGNRSFDAMVQYDDYVAHVTADDELRIYLFRLRWVVVLESFEEVDA